jgi:hypothetical protein
VSSATDPIRQRRHLTMLTTCAWRETRAGPAPVVAGLRQFLGGWLGIGRIVVGMARQSYDLQPLTLASSSSICRRNGLASGSQP